jgi:N-succinyldiaminopimelate aminotransferase
VYEHLVYTDIVAPHVPLATLPGMRERTLRISSAGKTFSCTGWKVGWACGPAPLVSAVTRVKQFLTFVNAGPLQPAVAVALASPALFYDDVEAGRRIVRFAFCKRPAVLGEAAARLRRLTR